MRIYIFFYLIITVFLISCKEDKIYEEDKILNSKAKNLLGNYTGTYMECGDSFCYINDTIFRIYESQNSIFLNFGKINEEISLIEPNIIRSKNIFMIDSFNGIYGVTGYFKLDSIHLNFSSKFLNSSKVFKNSLDGEKN